MNTTKQKQTQIYREHNSGCQRGENHGEEQDWQRRLRGGNCTHKKASCKDVMYHTGNTVNILQ